MDKKPRARRLQDADRKALGEHVLSQEELRTYIVVAYIKRFKGPDESSWGEIAETPSKEIGLNKQSIKVSCINVNNIMPIPQNSSQLVPGGQKS